MKNTIFIFAIFVSYSKAIPFEFTEGDTNRITNGIQAEGNQFPYAVSLQHISGAQLETRGHRCGGVLITWSHVLTAASCLHYTFENGTEDTISPFEYRIFAGSNNLLNDTSPERIRTIANYTIHPNFVSWPSHIDDIAVITVSSPFTAESGAQPLPIPAVDFNPPDFTLCTVAGWGGRNISEIATTELKYSNKYIYNHDLCTQIYNMNAGSVNIFPSMTCAASFDILSSGCWGDEGSPLVCNGTLTGIMFQNHRCITSSFPEVYSTVASYSAWIRGVTGSASTFAPGIAMLTIISVVQMLYAGILK